MRLAAHTVETQHDSINGDAKQPQQEFRTIESPYLNVL